MLLSVQIYGLTALMIMVVFVGVGKRSDFDRKFPAEFKNASGNVSMLMFLRRTSVLIFAFSVS